MSQWMNRPGNSMPDAGYISTNPFGNFTVVDAAPKEILHMIDPHWYQFPPLNPMWYGLLGFTITVLGILSITGNTIVMWVFLNTKSLRSPANLLVVNLALSDFGMMATMFPPMVTSCYYGTWAFSALFCEIYGCFGSLFGCASIWSMVFITADRYNVIVKGVSGTPLTNTGALIRIMLVWVFSLAWTLLPFFGWNRYVPEGNLTACGTDYLTEGWVSQSYLYVYGAWVYFLPLILIIYYYTFIVSAVFAHEKQMREQAKKMGVKSLRNEEAQKTSAECRLAKVALTTVALWFIAWTPYLVINFAGMLNKPMINPLFTIWGSLFAKANAVYNPIVYAISHPKYRAALEKKLPCLSCSSSDGASDSVSATTTQSDSNAEKTETA
ncbi:LWS opsin 1 [Hyalella azteca]|uniref:LWS opsin 1 n=1 Tax=Hyalella azteca TaxID=294128 RepID=A0A6A0GRY6_HYAAZ|nr:rhodopsin [Hyalella azteca]KAA0186110.1 LWS opsin 1 [Hyalella azteca]